MSMLTIKNLHIDYVGEPHDTHAVKDVHLELQQGEIFALIGESGSGKSTVAKAILRILQPPAVIRSGEIWFDGQNILAMPPSHGPRLRWSGISMVFQSALSALNPTMTVREHFNDTFAAHAMTDKAACQSKMNELLQMVGLELTQQHKYPHQLSGGMRQRVVIALALSLSPSLIIFDEPTTALDVVVEREIMGYIQDLQAKLQFSALFISHDLALMMEYAHRFGVMKSGQLLEVLTAEELQTAPKNQYTKELLKALPSLTTERKLGSTLHSQTPLLHVENLSKRFDAGLASFWRPNQVLNDVSFTLHQAEALAIVGASGSGKSTIGKIICGLLRPSGGSIRWENENTRRCQMIFQDPFDALNPIYPISHGLERALVLSGKPKSQTSELLEQVGLHPASTYLDKFPHELSGGQRQRVVIARCIASDPDIIVADEATSMLDVSIRIDILRLLQNIQTQRKVAFLLITHDLAIAREFAHRIIVLDKGVIVEEGPADQVIRSPTHSYTQTLVAASTRQTTLQGKTDHD